jgi:hypothetical protein
VGWGGVRRGGVGWDDRELRRGETSRDGMRRHGDGITWSRQSSSPPPMSRYPPQTSRRAPAGPPRTAHAANCAPPKGRLSPSRSDGGAAAAAVAVAGRWRLRRRRTLVRGRSMLGMAAHRLEERGTKTWAALSSAPSRPVPPRATTSCGRSQGVIFRILTRSNRVILVLNLGD